MSRCPLETACLGVDPNEADQDLRGECSDGYGGVLCHTCEEDYSRLFGDICYKCPPLAVNIILSLVIGGIAAFFLVILIRSNISLTKEGSGVFGVYLKIFSNYTQLIMITVGFRFNWPVSLQTFFDMHDEAGSFVENLVSIECFMDPGVAPVVYQKALGSTLLPILFIIGVSCIWYILQITIDVQFYKHKMIGSTVMILYLTYPNILKSTLSLLSCQRLDDGNSHLNEDFSIECWTNTHVLWVIGVALPSILIWGIATPLIILRAMMKNRKTLNKKMFYLKFSYLINGFHDKYYYWEFLILYRKLILTILVAFLQSADKNVQALIALALLIVFVVIQLKFKPFCVDGFNKMEVRSLFCSAVITYFGLFYVSEDLSDTSEALVTTTLILANLYFFVYWSFHVWIAARHLIKKKKPHIYLNYCFPNAFEYKAAEIEDYVNLRHQQISLAYMDEIHRGIAGDHAHIQSLKSKKKSGPLFETRSLSLYP